MSAKLFDTSQPSMGDTTMSGPSAGFEAWYADNRARVLHELDTFLRKVDIEDLRDTGVDAILRQYAVGGKCVRSTFMYLGWLCGAQPDPAALRAAASLELLHGFALLQDDVMDDGVLRRGSAAAHVRLTDGYRERGLPGSASRFGKSAAVLLGDMCLVWAEQMLRDSGIPDAALRRVWAGYDAMRIELAIGQFADLANDARATPTMDSVLAIARAKSGNYTVLRPLELGATMAGCPERTLMMLARYGTRIGEAFQLRDDLLGIFGSAATTGKPEDSDLGQHKATSVIVAALDTGGGTARRELTELLSRPELDAPAIARCRELIAASGAPERIESMITDRVTEARAALADAGLDQDRCSALERMALLCTARQQ